MDFVAIKDDTPICLLSGCSDVLHIDGIGGYGNDWIKQCNGVPTKIDIAGWAINCLPKSGLLRLFCNSKITVGSALSSFKVYSVPKNK